MKRCLAELIINQNNNKIAFFYLSRRQCLFPDTRYWQGVKKQVLHPLWGTIRIEANCRESNEARTIP